ncbi:uncharacterized protein G2W53_037414 [Senna tora]|uniref:Uncharacterized protein n=1 Tax=Senna tora TaxID=362788 RepID=A0A834SVQ9_9FABA|nr:uncharacterized protein G2W53_037414 [Senna tora]
MDEKSRSDVRNVHELRGKSLIAQVSETVRFALYLRNRVDLMLELESSRRETSVDHVLAYCKWEISVKSLKRSRVTRQKPCCANEKSRSDLRNIHEVRVKRLVAQERGLSVNISWTRNPSHISETFMNYEARALLRKSLDQVLTNSGREIAVGSQKHSQSMSRKPCCANKKSWSNLRNIHELRGKRLVAQILEEKSRTDLRNVHKLQGKSLLAQVGETRGFALYLRNRVDLMLELESSWHGRNVDHVLTYFKCEIVDGSKKRSQSTSQKLSCAVDLMLELESSWLARGVYHVLTNSGREITVGSQNVHKVREKSLVAQERGSCLNIFWLRNRSRISETFTKHEWKALLRKNIHELQGKSLLAQVSETGRFTLYLRNRVDLMLKLESSWHGRNVDHALAYSEREFTDRSQTQSQSTSQKPTGTMTETGRFALHSQNRVDLMVVLESSRLGRNVDHVLTYSGREMRLHLRNVHEVRVKSLVAQSSWNGRSMDHVLTYSEREIPIRSQKHSQIMRQKLRCASKSLVAQLGETGRFALYLQNRVDFMLELESSWHGRSVDHVLTYSKQEITDESQKRSQSTSQKPCCARGVWIMSYHILDEKSRSGLRNFHEVHVKSLVVLAKARGFHARIGVVMAWENRGSCPNILWMRNCGGISETFTKYESKALLHKNVYELRGKSLVAQVSETGRFALYLQNRVDFMLKLELSWHGRTVDHSVRVVFAKPSGVDTRIGVVMAWEERGSCLIIFRTMNPWQKQPRSTRQKPSSASEFNRSVRVVFAKMSGFSARFGVIMAWEERRSCLNLLRMRNPWLDLRKVHELRGKSLVAQVSETSKFALYS